MARRHSPKGALNTPDVRAVPVFIYALAEPGSLTIRYVGKSESPRKRFSSHCSMSSATPMRLFHWVHTLAKSGDRPQLIILRTVSPGEDAATAEREAIAKCEADGHPLLNYHGVKTRQPKLDSRRPNALLREIAQLGNSYVASRAESWSAA